MGRAMKDSGVDWIGDIPEGWEVKRVKDVCHINKGKSVETHFEQTQGSLPYIDTTFLRKKGGSVYAFDGVKVFPGKILILWDGANAGELFLNNSFGYLGSTFGKLDTNLNNKFLYYYLKGIEQYSRDNLIGMGIPHVNGAILRQTAVPVPNKIEQQSIANHLDTQTSKIDKEISLLEKKSKLLDEYRKSLIFETVTKGLNKSVPMKDSGVDWVGEIPESWEDGRLGSYIHETSQRFKGLDGLIEMLPLSLGNGEINVRDLDRHTISQNSENYKLVEPNDLVVGIRAWQNSISISNFTGFVSPAYKVYRVSKKIFPTYFKYFLNNPKIINEFISISKGICSDQWKISDIEFRNLHFYLPPFSEQLAIANYLDTQTAKIDKQKELITKKIELLKEYRKSLIFECVTGKKEIKPQNN